MSPRSAGLSIALEHYIETVGVREHPDLAGLRSRTDALEDGGMRSSAVQAQLLAFLVELLDARAVLEIGCFTGYATLAMALALAPGGRIITLDADRDRPAIGQQAWQAAGVAERIELRVGLAMASIADLPAATFDLIYIDADKKSYDAYYEAALRLARPGAVIALDNMLWHGAVADPDDDSRQARTLRALNAKIHADPRVTPVLLPIGDGLTLARRR